ncbi:MAG: RNA polymerase sigma factor [Candidatus Acidiferrum sp.]
MPDARAIPLPGLRAAASNQSPENAPAGTQPEPGARAEQTSAAISAQSSDEELILAARGGSEAAFTTLFHRYKRAVFGFFSRRLTDSARAEELTQDTFLALFRAAARYEPSAPFRSYLHAIAFRILRSDRRKSIFRSAFLGSAKAAESASTRGHTENSLWIRRALAKLDSTDREIVMLREYQQLSYAEIATVLQIPLNTVRSRLFRARTALRSLLIPPEVPPPSQNSSGISSAAPAVLAPRAFSAPESPAQIADPSAARKEGLRQ